MGHDGGGMLRGGVRNGGDNSRVDVGNIMVAGNSGVSSTVRGGMMVVVMVVEALVDSRLTFALFSLSSLASLHSRISNPENLNSPRYICQQ